MSRTTKSIQVPTDGGERLLSEIDLGALLGNVAVSSIRKWRLTGRGPKFIKIANGKLVRYRRADIDAWLIEHERSSTADTARAPRAQRTTQRGRHEPTTLSGG